MFVEGMVDNHNSIILKFKYEKILIIFTVPRFLAFQLPKKNEDVFFFLCGEVQYWTLIFRISSVRCSYVPLR